MENANPTGYHKCEHPKVEDHGMAAPKNVIKDYSKQGWYGNSDPYKSDNYKDAK